MTTTTKQIAKALQDENANGDVLSLRYLSERDVRQQVHALVSAGVLSAADTWNESLVKISKHASE